MDSGQTSLTMFSSNTSYIIFIVNLLIVLIIIYVIYNTITGGDITGFNLCENYVSYHSCVSKNSKLKKTYEIWYVKNNNCHYCNDYNHSLSDQISFIKSLGYNPLVRVVDINNKNDLEYFLSTPLGEYFLNQRTTPFVCLVRDGNYSRPMILQEDKRDDIYMYMHAWETDSAEVQYLSGIDLSNYLNEKIIKTNFRRNTRRYFNRLPILSQYRDVYSRRSRGYHNFSRKHRNKGRFLLN